MKGRIKSMAKLAWFITRKSVLFPLSVLSVLKHHLLMLATPSAWQYSLVSQMSENTSSIFNYAADGFVGPNDLAWESIQWGASGLDHSELLTAS